MLSPSTGRSALSTCGRAAERARQPLRLLYLQPHAFWTARCAQSGLTSGATADRRIPPRIDIKAVQGETLPRGRALFTGELRVLFTGCADGRNAGMRDQALLAVLCRCEIRRSQAVALDVGDYDSEAGTLRVLAGKGNEQRLVHLPPGAKQAPDRWVWLHRETLGTHESVQQMGKLPKRTK